MAGCDAIVPTEPLCREPLTSDVCLPAVGAAAPREPRRANVVPLPSLAPEVARNAAFHVRHHPERKPTDFAMDPLTQVPSAFQLCQGRPWMVPMMSVGLNIRMACALPALLLTVSPSGDDFHSFVAGSFCQVGMLVAMLYAFSLRCNVSSITK